MKVWTPAYSLKHGVMNLSYQDLNIETNQKQQPLRL